MAHAAAGRSGHAGDEGDDWLGVRTLRGYFMNRKGVILSELLQNLNIYAFILIDSDNYNKNYEISVKIL